MEEYEELDMVNTKTPTTPMKQ